MIVVVGLVTRDYSGGISVALLTNDYSSSISNSRYFSASNRGVNNFFYNISHYSDF